MTTPNQTFPNDVAGQSGSEQPEDNEPQIPFPIVGLGASAGGLEAFSNLLRDLPSDTGMAFVLVQHLDPNHESILAHLIAQVTKMKVEEAQEGMKVVPNCVYVIPPGKEITIVEGALALEPRTRKSNGTYMPIDVFFRSLAEIQGSKAVAVVLSGNGSDGALGIEEIHRRGGISIVQDPSSAKFDGMPQSALSTHYVDLILAPSDIAAELARIGKHPFLGKTSVVAAKSGEDETARSLSQIFALLRTRTGVDFTQYKRNTLDRRISRRMVLHQIEALPQYLGFLKDRPDEIDALQADFLINVTRFFRDPEAFEVLRDKVFGELMKDKPDDFSMRFWIPGCSTGEEVYSLAIALLEFLGDRASRASIQIFGSDLSEKALEKARAGTYIENIALDISPERLTRFFTIVNGRYQVNKNVREICIFAKQNIVADPPFSRLDLISCRNVLIYFNPALQRKAFPIFHFSLNPKGCLLLGSAETVGTFSDLFSVIDRKHRIFGKNSSVPSKLNLEFNRSFGEESSGKKRLRTDRPDNAAGRISVPKEVDRTLINRYAPCGVIVNDNLEIIQFRGDTSPYFQNPPGEPSLKLLKLAREGLQSALDAAIKEAKDTNANVRKEGLHVESGGEIREVDLEVLPIAIPLSTERYWGLMFDDRSVRSKAPPDSLVAEKEVSASKDGGHHWKRELDTTKAFLESVIEEREAMVGELQSANEEVLSSNEELQSINEEIQTAKEELQSTNEELTTLNDELHRANLESLQHVNDLNNLLDSVRIPVIIVGSDLKIRRFTPAAEKLLHLIPGDVGRPIGDVNSRFPIPDLEKMLLEVMNSIVIKEQQIHDGSGIWYSLRIHPYKTVDKKIEGAVVVLVDVESMKRTEIAIAKARDTAEDILATVREPLIVLDAHLKIKRANPSFYVVFNTTPEATEGKSLFEIGNGHWDNAELRSRLGRVISGNTPINGFEIDREFPPVGFKSMVLNAAKVFHRQGEDLILLAIEDMTEIKKAAETIREKANALARANKDLEDFSHIVAHDLKAPLRKTNSFIELLRKDIPDALSEKSSVYMGHIVQGCQKMADMIDGVLKFSKATAIQQSVGDIDLNDVVRDALTDLDLAIDESNAQVVVGTLPKVKAQALQMSQVMVNLLENAIKYRGTEPLRIELSVKEENNFWVFSVRDNGLGIDQSDSQRIFDLFQRRFTNGRSGSGVGLTICRRIVENYGGRIWVESEKGKGSTFSFTLPKN